MFTLLLFNKRHATYELVSFRGAARADAMLAVPPPLSGVYAKLN